MLILEFCYYKIIYLIIQVKKIFLILVLEKIIKTINESEEDNINLLINKFTSLLNEFDKRIKEDKLNIINNYKKMIRTIIFLYIIIYNIEKYENFKLIFEIENEKLIKTLKNVLKDHSKSGNLLCDVIMSICFNDFKTKFIDNSNDENEKEKISYYLMVFTNLFPLYSKPSLTFSPSHHIETIISNLNNFNSEIYEKLDNYVIDIFEGIIFIIFQNDNFDYFYFLDNLIKKHIELTKTFNLEVTSLFRKEDIYHKILKYFIFSFCNNSFIISVYNKLKNEYLYIFEKEFNIENFEKFFKNMIDLLYQNIPILITIILKIINNNINKEYKIQKNKFASIYTFLFFNFYNSPKIFEIYGLKLSIYPSIKLLNRLIRNIFYNKLFIDNDSLHIFNSSIGKYNNLINSKMENLLNSIDINDKNEINKYIKKSLSNISFPQFLTNYSTENIYKLLNQ